MLRIILSGAGFFNARSIAKNLNNLGLLLRPRFCGCNESQRLINEFQAQAHMVAQETPLRNQVNTRQTVHQSLSQGIFF